MALPKGNMIFWQGIPANACVTETPNTFQVRVGRRKFTAYWEGQNAREAQRTLKARAKKGCSR